MKPITLAHFFHCLTVVLIGCATGCQTGKSHTALEEMMAADAAFSDRSLAEGRNTAFLAFCADEAVMLHRNSYPIEGRAHVKNLLVRPDTAYTLTWKPMHGFVSRSGDLGCTYGTWEQTEKATGRKSLGTYATVWRKDAEGNWKWVLDTGNEGLGER